MLNVVFAKVRKIFESSEVYFIFSCYFFLDKKVSKKSSVIRYSNRRLARAGAVNHVGAKPHHCFVFVFEKCLSLQQEFLKLKFMIIPLGNSKEDFKIREEIISQVYRQWT